MSTESVRQWLLERAPRWKDIDQLQRRVEQGRHAGIDDISDLAQAYREIAHDLTLAQQRLPDTRVVAQLQRMYAELHRSLYRHHDRFAHDLYNLFRFEIPAIVRGLRKYIFWVVILFLGSGATGWLLVTSFPELAALFASEGMIDGVRSGELWTDGLLNVVPSSLLAFNILTNNIVVSLTACCLGLLFGLGTLYIIALNGLMLGGIFAFTAQHAMAGRLFEFVVAHGIVELSAICISGAVGVSIGEALARPGNLTRRAALEQSAKRGLKLMIVVVLSLLGAGIIEGYVSPNPDFSLASRVVIGISYMALFLLVLVGPRPKQTGTV